MAGYITRKTFYKALALAFFLFACNIFTFAQLDPGLPPCEDGSMPTPDGDCVDNPVPIDGGASILIAAGVAYGLKKAYDKRKQNKEADVA
ncbi:MAG: hypothetical protein REI64_02310 [Pedobacter sp.]|uniref:PID-CTERM protein-sorting domain-containing protein n=1 Tax=Pedobacter sp. TaxID=1411316 RepID=UPI002808C364|nr:hypothetical protein [Pedobacter sp.]MDQ8003601.1 hypothetical protein [Pedobacter sp.]